MSKVNRKRNFIPRLNPREININVIRNWINTQADALSDSVQCIEADIESISIFNQPIKKFSGRRAGIEFSIKKFLTKKGDLSQEIERVQTESNKLGLLIPISDIKNIHPKDLQHGINILAKFTADFSLLEFLFHLRELRHDDTPNVISLPIEGLLFTLERYINLVLTDDSLLISFAHIEEWFSHYIQFDQGKMPMYQLLEWLGTLFDAVAANETIIKEHEYAPSVLRIIEKYQAPFQKELLEVRTKRDKKFLFTTFPEFKHDLATLLEEDIDILLLYCTLKDIRDSRNTPYYPILRKAFNDESFSEKVSKIFSKKNVLNTVKSIIYKENSIHELSLFQNEEIEFDKINKYINRLETSDKRKLLQLGKEKLKKNPSFARQLENYAVNYQAYIANTFFRPFGYWVYDKKELYPLIDLEDQKITDDALLFLKLQKKHEQEEREQLEKYLKAIRIIQTRTSLMNLINATPKFFYKSNQRSWNLAIKDAEEAIKHRIAFRKMKMRELGIDLVKDFTDAQKEIYLTEMIQIEEEIQEFVPFVTASFKSALPAKRTTVFDPFRHQSDGVEFDPETTFDPEKWLRGNVMKTIKNKIRQGEVTQVNCFCLDLSGSMDHARMRNLYKMLYLLVTGLQSRKSFDAFHFFSNTFIPGVDFSDEYTKKSLLFRVLTIVSRIEGPRLVFEGLEGTNISDGIDGCLDRMTTFISGLKSRKPQINISASMFVITDGEPSLGIRNLKQLNNFVQKRREQTNFAIKAIYIKSHLDKNNFITTIFGEGNAVESTSFEEGVKKLTAIMTKTYREQRQQFKWDKKRAKLFSNKTSIESKTP